QFIPVRFPIRKNLSIHAGIGQGVKRHDVLHAQILASNGQYSGRQHKPAAQISGEFAYRVEVTIWSVVKTNVLSDKRMFYCHGFTPLGRKFTSGSEPGRHSDPTTLPPHKVYV